MFIRDFVLVSSNSSLDDLFFMAKVNALFHDPPHKILVLREHEDVARDIKKNVLSNVPVLSSGLPPEWSDVVAKADEYASSFDRWLLDLLYQEIKDENKKIIKDTVIFFNKLINIFDPRHVSDAIDTHDLTTIKNIISGVTGELNNLVKEISKKTSDPRILYETIYILYELMWLSNNLPITPADTRAPTHTTFDHLYATASMINISLRKEPSGYLVLIDIPGIQRFVSSARKVGDFWAGSWILSKVMWYTIEDLIKKYGPDILITPSPRLNPYLVKSLVNELRELGIDKNIIVKILGAYRETLRRLGVELEEDHKELEDLLDLIPLIPATTLLLLPKIDTDNKQHLRNMLKKKYREGWRRVINEVKNILRDKTERKAVGESTSESKLDEISLKILEKIEEIVSEPYTDIRIDIVDLKEVYDNLKNCLENERPEKCKTVGIDTNAVNKIKSELGPNRDETLSKLAEKLTWLIAITKGLAKSRLENPPPQPRHFWVYNEKTESLTPVFSSLVSEEYIRNWVHCSLDGEEPAVIHLKKIIKESVEDYEEESLRTFLEKFNLKDIDREELKILVRPGEALGPYCLLKRITYMAYRDKLSKILKISSTDDVVLGKFQESISKWLKKNGLDKLSKKVSEIMISERIVDEKYREDLVATLREVLESIFPRDAGIKSRDIYKGFTYLNLFLTKITRSIGYDTFISILCRAFSEIFQEDPELRNEFTTKIFSEYSGFIGTDKYLEKVDISDLAKLSCIRTSYAIVKADGDNIGKLIIGDLESLGLDSQTYAHKILEALRRDSKVIVKGAEVDETTRNKIFDILSEFYKKMVIITENLLGSKYKIVVSPAYTSTLSISLMINSLHDINLVRRYFGFPVFSGGDDLLALLPLETALPFAFRSRESFNGENMFHYIKSNTAKIPIASALPTGRSYSVRFTQLMDIMSREIEHTVEILDKEAKDSKWRIEIMDTHKIEVEKDTLVVSDSRSNFLSHIPLKIGDICDTSKIFTRLALIFSLATFTRYISSSFPEDLEALLTSYFSKDLDPEILKELSRSYDKLFMHALARNIKTSGDIRKRTEEAKKIVDDILDKKCGEAIYTTYRVKDNVEIPLILSVSNLVRILRGYP